VLNKLIIPLALNGFVMNSDDVAVFPNPNGCALTPASSFFNALARLFESCIILAPDSSAMYSLDLDIASCIIVAMIGVKIASTNSCIPFPLLSSLPPNITAHCAIVAM